MSKKIGLYIHIPFCKSKCAYCDFFSGKASEEEYDIYTAQLTDKIKYWGETADETVSSIYFGGGTPSVLGSERLCGLLDRVKDNFTIEQEAEITVEINPESGKSIDFSRLFCAGFNRISIGLQSCVKEELDLLGRIHTPDDARVTVENARRAGFNNISLDLMMGIPNQTRSSLKQSIDFCNSCGVEHISSYILKIEKGTKFYSLKEQLNLPDEDSQAELYLFAVEYLDKLGYKQYEISNFSKPGFESRHNTLYWKCGEYIGIGPSAHSYYHGKRFHYERNTRSFFDNVITDDGDGGGEDEYIMLSLRLKTGLVFEEFEKNYRHPLSPTVISKIKRYAELGYMELDSRRACFTPKGFLVSNTILSDLLCF